MRYFTNFLAATLLLSTTFTLAVAQDSNPGSTNEQAAFDDNTLKVFADLHPRVLSTQRKFRQEMLNSVKEVGLSPNKFAKMLDQRQDITADDSDYSDEEKKAFLQAMTNIVEIQEELNNEIRMLLQNAGLSFSQYQRMAAEYSTSKEMRKKVKQFN